MPVEPRAVKKIPHHSQRREPAPGLVLFAFRHVLIETRRTEKPLPTICLLLARYALNTVSGLVTWVCW